MRVQCAALIAGVIQLAAGSAQAQLRVEVQDARQLLLAAIDAPEGSAHGLLVGRTAQAVTARFKGTSPLHIEVSTVRRYRQEGCRRLNIRVWQEGVHLPAASAPKRQTLDVGVDYCRDGKPPLTLDEAPP